MNKRLFLILPLLLLLAACNKKTQTLENFDTPVTPITEPLLLQYKPSSGVYDFTITQQSDGRETTIRFPVEVTTTKHEGGLLVTSEILDASIARSLGVQRYTVTYPLSVLGEMGPISFSFYDWAGNLVDTAKTKEFKKDYQRNVTYNLTVPFPANGVLSGTKLIGEDRMASVRQDLEEDLCIKDGFAQHIQVVEGLTTHHGDRLVVIRFQESAPWWLTLCNNITVTMPTKGYVLFDADKGMFTDLKILIELFAPENGKQETLISIAVSMHLRQ